MVTGKPERPFSAAAWLLLIIIVSTLLQSIAAVRQSFWEDEAFSANAVEQGFAALPRIIASDVHPPLYLTLATAWGQVAGSSEMALRSLSILLAVVTVWMVYQIGRKLASPGLGLLAAGLLAFSPVWLMFAGQARYYSLAAALAGILGLLTVLAQEGRIAWAAGYVLAAAMLVYSLYAAAAVILGCGVWWALRLVQQRAGPKAWAVWIAAHLAVGIMTLPAILGLLRLAQRFDQAAPLGSPIVELFKRLGYLIYVFNVGETLSPLNPLAWIGLALSAGVALLGVWRNRRHPLVWLAVIVFVASVIVSLVGSLNAGVSVTWQSIPTRTLFALPFMALLLAQGMLALAPRWRWAALGVLTVVFAAASFNFFTGRQYLRPVFAVPWREIFAGIRQSAAPDAQVWCAGGEDYACSYYARQSGFANATGDATLHSQVWWIEVNLGRDDNSNEVEQRANWEKTYRLVQSTPYARQDPGIRWLKQRFVGGEDYEYRVWVYQYELR